MVYTHLYEHFFNFNFPKTKTELLSKLEAKVYLSLNRCSPKVWKAEVPLQVPLQCTFISTKHSSYKNLRKTLSISTLTQCQDLYFDLSYFTKIKHFCRSESYVVGAFNFSSVVLVTNMMEFQCSQQLLSAEVQSIAFPLWFPAQ